MNNTYVLIMQTGEVAAETYDDLESAIDAAYEYGAEYVGVMDNDGVINIEDLC